MIKNSEETLSAIEKMIELIRSGNHQNVIGRKFPEMNKEEFEELFSIAKARVQNKKLPDNFFFSEDDLRFATNWEVAEYRAEKMKCDTIIDLCCGIGIQSIAFAKTCKKVIAIDIDERKVKYAKLNAEVAGVGNIEFHTGDALEFAKTIKTADAVFCDPSRPPEEQSRSMDSFTPNPEALMNSLKKVTSNFCFELPPQIKEFLPGCEKEYVSVNFQLNRLNAYFGKLKSYDVSAMMLPQKKSLNSDSEEFIFAYASPLQFLYEIDGAVLKSELVSRISEEGLFFYDKYLTSEKQVRSDFFKASYKIIFYGANSHEIILARLKDNEAGQVVLHGKVEPSAYWEERNFYEKKLEGEKTFHLFVMDSEVVLCEKIN